MTYDEKNTWVFGVIAIVGYAVYLTLVLPQLAANAPSDVAYQWPMVWTIVGAIGAGVVGGIVLGIFAGKGGTERDERDRQIERFGDRVGNGFVVIGGVGALLLALLSAEHFWIANLLYLCFVISAVLQVIAKVVAYRRGLQSW